MGRCFECIKDVLKGVEVLEMSGCLFNGDVYENYLKYCPKLKSLSVSISSRTRDKNIIIGNGNDWLFRRYLTLRNLELIEFSGLKMNELKVFFDKNPNMRTFSADSKSLWVNRHSLLNSSIRLDTLAIDIYQSTIYNRLKQSTNFIDWLHLWAANRTV